MANLNRFIFFILLTLCLGATPRQDGDQRFLSFVTDPKTSSIRLYWKGDNGQPLRSLQNLKLYVESKGGNLRFAMNGGMYTPVNSPQGLFIENTITQTPLDTLPGSGNFYMKPNGVFYLTSDNVAFICTTPEFTPSEKITFATQSGPMLLIDGEIHPAFKNGSANLNIRNGVGVLPDSRVVFAVSTEPVNFYDFAMFFKKLNCKNALYLDGFVSRTYFPEKKWKQLDGNFGVIIGVID
jgi:uncharacterized protein YigE (DUF2233 family)